MKANFQSLIVTALVAAIAGFGGVGLGRVVFGDQPPPSMHTIIHERLHLTPAQDGRVEALEHAFASRRTILEGEMRAANADLAAAIRDEHGYGPKVNAAVTRFHEAMGTLQTETIRHVFAMREILTPAQQLVFDNTVSGALTAESD